MASEKFTPISLHREMQRSYLEYAMSVIVGRALPDARDGLKPVQRRILFAMHELGLTPDRPFRKCARVVGDVLGKYHPHGDQAVYDALVRLVQDFSSKYPALDGHGNFGSVDDDPPAAMRYTETRLSRIANETLLTEIDAETVSFSDNFDSSQKEPDVLPAQLPFLLLNGSSGIAVGMATNIPPHNIGEVIDGLIKLINTSEITDLELNKIIVGPDFPTGGELIYSENITDVYRKGRGSITLRGVIHLEEIIIGKGKHKKNALVITELPYQISKAGWIEKLAELVNEGKISGISDIRDESDREGMRIIVELKRDFNHEIVISDLYKKTSLQSNFGVIFLAIVNGKPVQLSLKDYLLNFIEFRKKTIEKRTIFYLKIALDKLEILEGFSIAVQNIKKIIAIVQESENTTEAKFSLSKEMNLSEKQSDAVLSMPIKKLTNLERNQVAKDIKKLKVKTKELKEILDKKEVLESNLIEELKNLKQKYNVKRKTKVIKNLNIENEVKFIKKQLIEDCINKKIKLIIDSRFYLKKLQLNNYKKILDAENKFITKSNAFRFICDINKNLQIIGITDTGKVIQVNWKESINNDCKLDNKLLNNINPTSIINFHSINNTEKNYLCILNNLGKFKKVLLEKEMLKTNRIFSIMKINEDKKIINSFISDGSHLLMALTSIGRIFKFDLSNEFISPSSKQAQGSSLIKLMPQETIISCCRCNKNENIIIATKKGKFFKINQIYIHNSCNAKLGYIHENLLLKNDSFLKIFAEDQHCFIETNFERLMKLNLNELNFNEKKYLYDTKFIDIEEKEHLQDLFCFDNLI